MKKHQYSFQEWLPFEKILENGIIKLKNNEYVKILKITPINFDLKSDLEKQAIFNSYKLFLKTCDFNIQILIQSIKEDLSKHISKIEKEKLKKENQKIINIFNQYIKFIKEQNSEKKSASKNFLILIKYIPENNKTKSNEDLEKIIINNLNEKYFKIKECLYRCGNNVKEYSNKKEIVDLFYSFFNYRKYIKK